MIETIFNYYWGYKGKRIANKIKKCFDACDFKGQSFILGGVELKASNGATRFYDANQIDEVVENINKLIDELDPD